MDATLPIAPIALPPASLADTPPWEIEIDESPLPVRVMPRKVAPSPSPAKSEGIHWSVTALTVLTAVVLVFGARAEEGTHSWVIASAVQPGE